jgi:hypothetical protein
MGAQLSRPQQSKKADPMLTSMREVDDPRTRLTSTDWVVAGGVAIAIVVALSPVWTTSFGFLDDYAVLVTGQTDPTGLWHQYLMGGRPITGLIMLGFLSFVHTIDQLVVMRIFSVLCLALVSLLGFVALRRLGYHRLSAWTFGLGMLWLPSTQVLASWSILVVGSAALLIAVVAAMRASEALDLLLVSDLRWTNRVMLLVPSVLLLSTAVCADQPAAMAFWPVMCLLLLAPSRRRWPVKKLLAGAAAVGAVGGVSCAVGYVAVKAGTAWVGTALARGALVTDIGGKLHYIVWSAAPRVFDPWTLVVHYHLAIATALALAVLLPLAIGGTLAHRLVGLGLVMLALPLSYLPSILTAENWASARSLAGAYVVPLAALALVVEGVPRLASADAPLRAVAAAAVGVVAIYAGYQGVSNYFAKPEHEELALARNEIRPLLVGVRSPVVVIRSDWTETLAPGVSFDEFGLPSSYATWVPVPLTELLAREATGRWLPDVTLVEPSELRLIPRTTLVIDYRRLLDRAHNAVVYRGPAQR